MSKAQDADRWATVLESGLSDRCCFRRAVLSDEMTEREARDYARESNDRYNMVDAVVVVYRASELGQRLDNGHVRLVSEGTVTVR